ncbi:hypothetical protein PIB30_080574 [Stylosanthes scabra]|uniref:PAZ domain-containing protein n=1 Tax=Stylosanthes scabra TaxID=79078 RepID=A0ABU6QR56_9FABA|nr:hypothetical protein [Stylosanthes scabra]
MKLWFRAGRNDAGIDSPTDGEKKRMRRQSQSKTIKVVISYATNIPIQAITDALRGQDSEHFQEALRVLDIILRQHAAKQGCLLEKRVLKSLRIRVNNMEYKISGLSENPCRSQLFSLKHGKDENGEPRKIEITVYDYFKCHKNIELRHANFPCINVGKPRRPTYFLVELCTLISLQRYSNERKKALASVLKQINLITKHLVIQLSSSTLCNIANIIKFGTFN